MATLGMTGKRPKDLYGYDYNAYKPLAKSIYNICEKLIVEQNVTNFISGGAQGADQIFFRVIEKIKKEQPTLHLQNKLYMPFPSQDSTWSKTGLFSQEEYQSILKCADERFYVGFEPNKSNYFIRNRKIVDDSDILLVITKIENSVNQGGTGSTLQYAQKKNKPLILIVSEKL